jgi:hypothetical protein
MRASFVASASALTIVLAALLFVIGSRLSRPVPVRNEDSSQLLNVTEASAAPLDASQLDTTATRDVTAIDPNPPGLTPQPAEREQTDATVRAAELMELALNNDSASLKIILAELGNPNRAIRNAALQAAVQFGSRDAIPSLRQATAQVDDSDEKAELLQAIEFLKLPSLSEAMAPGD